MEDPSIWIRLIESVGLPTALLGAGMWFISRMTTNFIVPWVQQLVQSHIEFVDAMRAAHKECNEGHRRIEQTIETLKYEVELLRKQGGSS